MAHLLYHRFAVSVSGTFDAAAEIADSSNFLNVRFYTVELTESLEPLFDTISKPRDYTWGSGPGAFDEVGGRFSWPSAACYFFGREPIDSPFVFWRTL